MPYMDHLGYGHVQVGQTVNVHQRRTAHPRPSKDRERLEIYREVQRNLRERLKLTAEAAGP